MKDRMIFLLVILSLLSLTLVSTFSFVGVQRTYDEMDDSSINASLWNVSATGNFPPTISEDTEKILIRVDSSDDGIGVINSVNLSNIEQIYNISFRYKYNLTNGGGNTGSSIFVFNTQIDGKSRGTAGDEAGDHIWLLERNASNLAEFIVFRDGAFNRTIVATNNRIEMTASSGATGNDVNAELFFVRFTLFGQMGINLAAPSNGTALVSNPIPFTANLNSSGNTNLTNATVNIWYSNGTIFNQTTNIISGNGTTNTTSWDISSFPLGTFLWNVDTCGVSEFSDTACSFADQNSTFDFGYFINASSFDLTTFETDREVFQFNITTIPEVISVSAILNYNGTEHTADVQCTGVSCTLTSAIDIPLISNNTIAQNFFFQTTLFTGSDSLTVNLTSGTQTVSQVVFDVCNATLNVGALNFTVFDEQTNVRIDPFYIAGEFDFWLGTGQTKKQLSFSNLSATELGLCISPPDRVFNIDDTIEYNQVINSTIYNTRNYYFQNDTINNVTRHVPLFLLNVDDSTSFILKVQDTNLLPVSGALINIQRLDVGTGNFSTVQIAKTDDNGLSVGFFKTETVDYRFIITKNGQTLLTTTAGKVVPETAPFTLTFTVGADEGAPWIRFEDLPDLEKSITFNRSTAITSYTYIDTSGNFTLSRLTVRLQNLSGFSQVICDINSTQASATLLCDTGNVTGTYTASGFITRGAETFLVEQVIFKIETFSLVAGLLGVFLAWFIILISVFAFKFNEIAGIVLMNLAVIFVNMIGLVAFGFLFIFGMMGVSIMIIVVLKR